MSTTVAVYDTKPYDRQSLARVEGAEMIEWRFLDFRLGPETAQAASGAQAVCAFVNDDAGRAALENSRGSECGCWPCVVQASTEWTCRQRRSWGCR
jgi:hypothetical protein